MNLKKTKDLKITHKIKLNTNPIFATSYSEDDICEIDRIEEHGDRVRVYPKNRKNDWEYFYHKEFDITLENK